MDGLLRHISSTHECSDTQTWNVAQADIYIYQTTIKALITKKLIFLEYFCKKYIFIRFYFITKYIETTDFKVYVCMYIGKQKRYLLSWSHTHTLRTNGHKKELDTKKSLATRTFVYEQNSAYK